MSEFIEVKTADLIEPALDWAVAKAEGLDCGLWKKGSAPGYTVIIKSTFFCPATKWSDCGPLFEKYRPDMQTGPGGMVGAYLNNNGGDPAPLVCCTGETYLIALCRAIAFHKLGDTVQVPKELMP